MSQTDFNLGTSSSSSTPTQREIGMSFMEVKKAVKGFPILGKEKITVKEWSNTLSYLFSNEKWTSKKNIYEACLLTTTGVPYSVIAQLKSELEDLEGQSAYPSFDEIKDSLLTEMNEETDPEELYEKIRNYRIRDKESIKLFNRRFMKLYRELSKEFQHRVDAYLYSDAIKSRFEPWKEVAKKRNTCSLMEAMKIAEEEDKYQKLNKKINNFPRTHNNNTNKGTSNPSSSPFKNVVKRSFSPQETVIPNDDTIDNLTDQFSKMGIHVCYRCGQKGHHARFCTNELSAQNIKLPQKLNDQGYLN